MNINLLFLGDLKLVEKPSPLTLAPHDFANIKANVKVASTENGIIFGNIGKKVDVVCLLTSSTLFLTNYSRLSLVSLRCLWCC